MPANDIQSRLDYGDAVAEWLVELSGAHLDRGDAEAALQCLQLAGSVYARQNRTLTAPALERALCRAAEAIPEVAIPEVAILEVAPAANGDGGETAEAGDGSATGCLHVMSEALAAGGVLSMAVRWIGHDGTRRRHDVALLGQTTSVPEALLVAVAQSGGRVFQAGATEPLTWRAAWLRAIARCRARYVILHTDVSDVIAAAAFGLAGGPPVLLVNHTAHLYWTGAWTIDLLLHCRGSELEEEWAGRYRGVRRAATVPIPLSRPGAAAGAAAARGQLGLPSGALVILTVGAAFKYLAAGELDFTATCERVLTALPDAVVVAAGFDGGQRWQSASARTGGRIRTLGRLSQEELAAAHAAADLYIEGFPFGTTTALLEAAIAGLPAVLAPGACPPPYGSDGIALDAVLRRPATVEEFEETVVGLARDPDQRRSLGAALQASVAAHHTGEGWRRHLETALAAAPACHAVYPAAAPERTPAGIHEYWFRFQAQCWGLDGANTLEWAVGNACGRRCRPRLTDALRAACDRAEGIRRGRTIPVPLLRLACRVLPPWLPPGAAARAMRALAFLFRPSPAARLLRMAGLGAARETAAPQPYEEYRGEVDRGRHGGGHPGPHRLATGAGLSSSRRHPAAGETMEANP